MIYGHFKIRVVLFPSMKQSLERSRSMLPKGTWFNLHHVELTDSYSLSLVSELTSKIITESLWMASSQMVILNIKFLTEGESKGWSVPSHFKVGINEKQAKSKCALETIQSALKCPMFLFCFIWKDGKTPDRAPEPQPWPVWAWGLWRQAAWASTPDADVLMPDSLPAISALKAQCLPC